MLTETEKQQIAAHAAQYPQKRGAVGDALKIVQRRLGWISDEALAAIAAALEMTTAEVDSIATFYSGIFRRPVGRHVIMICDSVSCYVTGYEDVRRRLCQRLGIDLGGTTADGRFTLLPAACLGLCDIAPAMMVDEDVHGNLTPTLVDAILAKYA